MLTVVFGRALSQLKTHAYLYVAEAQDEEEEEPKMSVPAAGSA